MFGAFPYRSRTKKGLTSWPTRPKARVHSGDQPLRPEVVVPRTYRRAVDPALLWPLRPEAVVPRTYRRAVDPALLWPLRPEAVVPRTYRRAVDPALLWRCRLTTLAGRSDRLQLEAQRCASSRVRAVL